MISGLPSWLANLYTNPYGGIWKSSISLAVHCGANSSKLFVVQFMKFTS